MLRRTAVGALALGALAAGCRLYASYPITPASDVLEWMAEHLPAVGGAAIQTEDEIAALSIVIGAGYAGVRAMKGRGSSTGRSMGPLPR